MSYIAPLSDIDRVYGTAAFATYDPLSESFLMRHQQDWINDKSPLKVAKKGRRTGITYAEAYDCVHIAMAAASAGGDNVWYIGDTKEKGREFVQTCAEMAKILAKDLFEVDEFPFDDVTINDAGDVVTNKITAWRITFSSGYRISALSSRPANIRGLQGVVVIDEAAFHANVQLVLDACLALLIWGGKIRIISSHNGNRNPFNDLVKEIEGGERLGRVHEFTFDMAVANGLYERSRAKRNQPMSPEDKAAWYNMVRGGYGRRKDAMREELDCIPREGDGTMIPLALIEACQSELCSVVRWEPPPDRAGKEFVDWPELDRRAHLDAWLREHVLPLLEALPADAQTALGEDFAMRQDRTALAVGYTDQRLVRRAAFLVELRTCPYDQQRQALYFICDFLRDKRRFTRGVLDANGNGMALAQEARQRYGTDRILELMPQDAWLLKTITPLFTAAFTDRTILIPLDLDVRNDIHQFRMVGGVGKIPTDVRSEGTDGGLRHADAAVAILNFFAATYGAPKEYAYQGGRPAANSNNPYSDDDDDRFGAGAF